MGGGGEHGSRDGRGIGRVEGWGRRWWWGQWQRGRCGFSNCLCLMEELGGRGPMEREEGERGRGGGNTVEGEGFAMVGRCD